MRIGFASAIGAIARRRFLVASCRFSSLSGVIRQSTKPTRKNFSFLSYTMDSPSFPQRRPSREDRSAEPPMAKSKAVPTLHKHFGSFAKVLGIVGLALAVFPQGACANSLSSLGVFEQLFVLFPAYGIFAHWFCFLRTFVSCVLLVLRRAYY